MITSSDRYSRTSSRVLARLYYLKESSGILATLFQRHKDSVFQLCLSYLKNPWEAEDATMEIFECLSQHLRRYQIKCFYSWLMIFSRNHCLRIVAQRSRRQKVFAQFRRCSIWDNPPAECRSRQERKLEKLHWAVYRLKREQRICLLRFYCDHLSYKEIAGQLNISTKAVKSHIQNGKRNLRKFMLTE